MRPGAVLELVRAGACRGWWRAPAVALLHCRARLRRRRVECDAVRALCSSCRPGNSGTHIGSVADNPAVGDQAVPAGHERNPTPLGGTAHAETAGSAAGPLHPGDARRARRVDRRRQGDPRRAAPRSSGTTTSATRSSSGPTPAVTRSSWPASRRTTTPPPTSCSAACTSWPSRPTCSPATTSA